MRRKNAILYVLVKRKTENSLHWLQCPTKRVIATILGEKKLEKWFKISIKLVDDIIFHWIYSVFYGYITFLLWLESDCHRKSKYAKIIQKMIISASK